MAADGNCLFRAIADQVYGDAELSASTRQMCMDYMEAERDHFSQVRHWSVVRIFPHFLCMIGPS
eukprot:7543742-Pyramimonas_sp.AAC.1